ncbi:hypothetical protein B0H11DRAFT_1931993 [Mycena galericulata]|nr:hypothetical protein B0H11DRAFT_1931993 [Mycena galericulata]
MLNHTPMENLGGRPQFNDCICCVAEPSFHTSLNASSAIIQYETDWNIEIGMDDNAEDFSMAEGGPTVFFRQQSGVHPGEDPFSLSALVPGPFSRPHLLPILYRRVRRQPSEPKLAENEIFGRYSCDLGNDFDPCVTRYVAYVHAGTVYPPPLLAQTHPPPPTPRNTPMHPRARPTYPPPALLRWRLTRMRRLVQRVPRRDVLVREPIPPGVSSASASRARCGAKFQKAQASDGVGHDCEEIIRHGLRYKVVANGRAFGDGMQVTRDD